MSCDLCKHEHRRADILCQPCREMIVRITRICRMNPEVLGTAEPRKQQVSKNRWWAEAAGAQS